MQRELSIKLGDKQNARGYQATNTSSSTGVISSVTNTVVTIQTDATIAVVQGENPTAVYPAAGSAGNDTLPAGKYRTEILKGNKIAFITASGTANVVVTVEG